MSVDINTKRTGRFIEWWPHIALGASVLVFLTLLVSPFFHKTLISQQVSVTEGTSTKLKQIELKPSIIGTLRIDAEAQINASEWVTFEIQMLDKQGKIIASGIKEGWAESGTWSEEGESGNWFESDTLGGLDVRAKQDEQITIAINVLGYGDNSGRDLNKPVPFRVTVENGVIETGYLWWGLGGSLTLWLISIFSLWFAQKEVAHEKINDSDITTRATVGGKDNLVCVYINVESDETSPRELNINLSINNDYGEQIYVNSFPVQLTFHREDGKFEKATASLNVHFILEKRSSYGFHVEVEPDAPVDKTNITVSENVRTFKSVEVTHIVVA